MKTAYLVAILAIILVVGCAQAPPVETTPEPPVETTPVVETPPVEEPPAEEEVTAAEIEILVKGYDPEELTVKKGTTVKWINTAPGVRILGGKVKSPRLQSGDIFEHTFEEAGEYTIVGIISKARGKVIVTE